MQKHREDSFPPRRDTVSNRFKLSSSSAAAISTSAVRRDLVSRKCPHGSGLRERTGTSALLSRVCRQGDANRSESDDEKKSDNFEEDEKVEQLRDTGKLTRGIVSHEDGQTNPADLSAPGRAENVLPDDDRQRPRGPPGHDGPAHNNANGRHAHAHTKELPGAGVHPGRRAHVQGRRSRRGRAGLLGGGKGSRGVSPRKIGRAHV